DDDGSEEDNARKPLTTRRTTARPAMARLPEGMAEFSEPMGRESDAPAKPARKTAPRTGAAGNTPARKTTARKTVAGKTAASKSPTRKTTVRVTSAAPAARKRTTRSARSRLTRTMQLLIVAVGHKMPTWIEQGFDEY